jgi:membrane fusion protein
MMIEKTAPTVVDARPENATPKVRALFRQEVLDARREKALGDVLLVQPVSASVYTLIAVGLAAVLIAFTFWGEYTRKAHVSGYLVPTSGLIKVYSRETGTIVDKRVVEGQRVSKGDILFVVSMERRSSASVDTQAAAMAQLEQRRSSLNTEIRQQGDIADIEDRALRLRASSKETELTQLKLEIATQEQLVGVAERSLGRYQELLAQLLASQEMVDEKRKDLLDQQGKLHALERNRIEVSQEIDGLRSQIDSVRLKAQTQRSAIARDMSQLSQELTEYESRRTFVVAAPADGTATAVLADLGQVANSSQPLVSLLPDDVQLLAHLIVPSHSIGFLAVDQTVALRYQSFPYQRFGSYGAHVAAISKTLILPDEVALPVPLKEPAYRVTVTLDSQVVKAYGQDFTLKAGMLVDADIWLERRKLYEWVLDPLYSVLGKV